VATVSALPASAADVPPAQPNDNLNAVLWDQTSVEARANAMGAYALAHVRLDQALADKSWTAAPVEETGMGDNVDTFLSAKEQPDWGSAKGTRRAFIAKDYRILLLLDDNLGDLPTATRERSRSATKSSRIQRPTGVTTGSQSPTQPTALSNRPPITVTTSWRRKRSGR